AFRHQCDAQVDDLFGAASDQIVLHAVDLGDDTAGARAHDPHDAFQQRALAVAVGAEQYDRLRRPDVKVDIFDHPDGAIGGVQALDGDAIAQGTPSLL